MATPYAGQSDCCGSTHHSQGSPNAWRGYRYLSPEERAKNRTKSRVRAKVEHAIGVIKRIFGFTMVRYRGLDKNAHRLFVTAALANLYLARRYLLRRQRHSCA
jgi:IS5 family transposase